MKFTRKYPVLVPFKDILKGNIFKKPNCEDLYVKIDNDEALCFTTSRLMSYSNEHCGAHLMSYPNEYFDGGCEILGKNFEDFIEKVKKNEYKKKKIDYLFPDEITFGSLFECDDGICMKISMDGLAVSIDDGRVVQLDKDKTYKIIEDYKMEIFE